MPMRCANWAQDNGAFARIVHRRYRLRPQEHLRLQAVGLLDAVGAFKIGRFGQDHVRVPGRIAEIDIDADDQVQLFEGLFGLVGVGNRFERIETVDDQRLDRIGLPVRMVSMSTWGTPWLGSGKGKSLLPTRSARAVSILGNC
jgi:hypothetical protein